jgi:hypothetical protein
MGTQVNGEYDFVMKIIAQAFKTAYSLLCSTKQKA